MINYFNLPKRVGLLGGGQLAQMLALAGASRGLHMHVLSEHALDPAAQVSGFWRQGSATSPSDLLAFLKQCDVATFESEFMDAQLLHQVSQKTQTKIYPAPRLMARLQDRLPQKRLLRKHHLPTADFLPVANVKDLHKARKALQGPFVLKKRRFGYDGYGTFFVRNDSEWHRAQHLLRENPAPYLAEKFIPFVREAAVVAVRSRSGQQVFYPFVESHQQDARCFWVKGPLRHTPSLRKLRQALENFLEHIKYVGAMGVELFDTGRGGWLVNELAPRVHNTGHYTQDAMATSQFENHLRAILNWPLRPPQSHTPGFAMVNLIGSSPRAPQISALTKSYLHWYGKTANRKGRKMGHINALGQTPEQALNLALRELKSISL